MRAALVVLVAGLAVPFYAAGADEPSQDWQFTGVAQGAGEVDVQARVTGELIKIAAKEGAMVAKGDVLAEIDPRLYQLDLDEAQARQKVAEAQWQIAKVKAANAKRLMENKVVSSEEVALSAAAESEAEAALAVARVAVERARLVLSWTRVVAPVDGRVSPISVSVGSLVTANESRIATIVSTEPLSIVFNVPEAILLQLRRAGLNEPGKLSVTIGLADETGFPHVAQLDQVAPEVNSKIGAAKFWATVPNPKQLITPGMFVRVRLTAKAP